MDVLAVLSILEWAKLVMLQWKIWRDIINGQIETIKCNGIEEIILQKNIEDGDK